MAFPSRIGLPTLQFPAAGQLLTQAQLLGNQFAGGMYYLFLFLGEKNLNF
jgi:hypothetical protein